MRIKVFLLALLTCLLASTGPALGASIDNKIVDRAHKEGKAAFFARLTDGAPLSDLGPEDKEALSRAADEYPGLFDHLMNIYYFQGDLDQNADGFGAGFVRLSEDMADELLDSVAAVPASPSLSPLKAVLSSAGFFSKKDYPFYKRFFRKMDTLPMQDWGIEELKIRDVHKTVQGAGARIAVIDSGLDATIREIRDRTRAYKSFLDGRWPPWDQGDFPYDYSGHGTMIATLAFKTAPSAVFVFIKVVDPSTLNETPVTIWTYYLVSAGLIWAVRNGADVISLSLAFDQDAPQLRRAALYCWKHNVVLVAAQGNARNGGGESLECYPAAYPTSIAVSGLEKDEAGVKPWRYSARGGFIDVAAPGAGLWADWPSNLSVLPSSKRAYGNSFAVPFVAGTAALMLSAMDPKLRAELKSKPGRLVESIRGVLRRTASNARFGLETPNDQAGYGMIDIEAAVRAVRGAD
ncbi:MAG: S8 family serine peptidase [Candidatus Aminicenantes bacterium]|nr:S8 family serine peptidase [Candidatus Aminicenantes bacterium]